MWYWKKNGESHSEWAKYDTLTEAMTEYRKRLKEFDFVELRDTLKSEKDGTPWIEKCSERVSERRMNI